jgi:hypothetical protein
VRPSQAKKQKQASAKLLKKAMAKVSDPLLLRPRMYSHSYLTSIYLYDGGQRVTVDAPCLLPPLLLPRLLLLLLFPPLLLLLLLLLSPLLLLSLLLLPYTAIRTANKDTIHSKAEGAKTMDVAEIEMKDFVDEQMVRCPVLLH